MDPDPPRLCMTGSEADAGELEARLSREADLHEVRLDHLRVVDDRIFDVIRRHGPRLIVACRPARAMGAFRGSEEDRLAILARVAAAGPAWVDLEIEVFEDGPLAKVPGGALRGLRDIVPVSGPEDATARVGATGFPSPPRILVSFHSATRCSERGLADLADRLCRVPADAVKVAVGVEHASDLLALRRFFGTGSKVAARHPTRVVIGLGDAGLITRARPAFLGSAWTYVASGAGRATAPGQWTLERAVRLRVRESGGLGPFLLVGGSQVTRSPGTDAYNALFRSRNLPLQYLPLPARSAAEALEGARALGARGLGVTMPLKREILSVLTPAAWDRFVTAAGAANTVWRTGLGGAAVFNTDAMAARAALRRAGSLEGAVVLILGSGGAAAAVGAAARSLGARVVLAARDPSRAMEACARAGDGWSVAPWAARAEVAHDVLVQTTPLRGDDAFPGPVKARLVVDLALGDDSLSARARRGGAETIGGLEFWCLQGAPQMSILTGTPITPGDLARALAETGWVRPGTPPPLAGRDSGDNGTPDGSPRSIVLTGMRGAGKSTLLPLLARRLGLNGVDSDAEVEGLLGRPIADLFRDGDETLFRRTEEAVIRLALRGGPVVLAAGGGAIERPETRAAMGDAFTVWLHAPADVLSRRIRGSGRPSLTGAPPELEAAVVLTRREALYRECADLVVSTGELDPEEACDVVERVWRGLSHHHVR